MEKDYAQQIQDTKNAVLHAVKMLRTLQIMSVEAQVSYGPQHGRKIALAVTNAEQAALWLGLSI